jgi:hypothetical protein
MGQMLVLRTAARRCRFFGSCGPRRLRLGLRCVLKTERRAPRPNARLTNPQIACARWYNGEVGASGGKQPPGLQRVAELAVDLSEALV